ADGQPAHRRRVVALVGAAHQVILEAQRTDDLRRAGDQRHDARHGYLRRAYTIPQRRRRPHSRQTARQNVAKNATGTATGSSGASQASAPAGPSAPPRATPAGGSGTRAVPPPGTPPLPRPRPACAGTPGRRRRASAPGPRHRRSPAPTPAPTPRRPTGP